MAPCRFRFEFLPYTVGLNYQNTLLVTREEVAIVILGPVGVIALFALLVIASWLLQRVLGNVPDVGSKFIMAVGIQAVIDPVLVLVVDSILKVSVSRSSAGLKVSPHVPRSFACRKVSPHVSRSSACIKVIHM